MGVRPRLQRLRRLPDPVPPLTSYLLFANRVTDPLRAMTGIGRYLVSLTTRLVADAEASETFELCAPQELAPPTWTSAGYRPVPGPRKLTHLAWTAVGRPRLERLVGEFDLVHATHPSFPVPTGHAGVVTVHDLMPLTNPEWYRREEVFAFRRALQLMGRWGWPVIAVSEHVKTQVAGLGTIDPSRVTVVYHGIGDEFRQEVPSETAKAVCERHGLEPGRYVLFIGHVSARKNVVPLVRAMAGVDPDLALAVAGRPDSASDKATAEIARLGLEGRVRLLGFVPDADLPALLQQALALVHPAVDEGFGIPPLEAMAAGTPVVASNAASLPEVVGDAGLLVDPRDPAAWTAAINRLAGDETLR
ncbi:MAG: glycosyltransferase family 4 protein, partial [Acidimicrobiaceae bacterium]|nr:glycosyltransferase family 4 protein [Acidimicrobiaceae bacterium]